MQIRNFVFHHPLVRYLKITKKNLLFMQWLSQWSTHKSSWALLSFSAFGLLITALVMQHVYDLQPCVMCIYQRTAVLGIGIAALLPVFYNHALVRLIGYIGWIVGAVWGFMLAQEHVEIIANSNPFFGFCEIVPNFPLPMHEWIPSFFAATGMCDDDSWQFLSMGFAEWMRVIFGFYTFLWVVVIANRLIAQRAL
jgi:protein dithiol:quinone oxidoreductase